MPQLKEPKKKKKTDKLNIRLCLSTFDKYFIAIGPRIVTVFQLMRPVLPDIEHVQYKAPFLNSKDFEH